MVEILNVANRSLALLAAQFQDLPINQQPTNLQSLIIALCSSGQDIQNNLQDLLTKRWLSTAIGVQLDGIGEILGLARIPGQSDDSYREALTFQVKINNGSGTPEQVIDAAKFFTKASMIWYIDVFPAAYEMISNGLNFPPVPSDVARAIQMVSPAGVRFIGLILTYNEIPFVFAGDESAIPLFVADDPSDTTSSVQLEMNSGDFLFVSFGIQSIPDFGGWFSELTSPEDTTGSGHLTELLPT